MAPIVKLIHGKDVLDLNSGRYCIDDASFMPPSTARAAIYSTALHGDDYVGSRAVNRSWSFNVHITGASTSEAERALRELQSFMTRAGNRVDPLYVAYRAFDDYDFEPYFGLFGCFARYEVVYATAEVSHSYNIAVGRNQISDVAVTLTIKPQSVTRPIPSGQASGGMFEDYIGRADGLPRGTVISAATTNKFTNPIFMASTYNTGWTALNVIDAENKNSDYVLFGTRSAKLFSAGAVDNYYIQSINVGNTNTHVISFYVKAADGEAISAAQIRIREAANKWTPNVVTLENGWHYFWIGYTGVASAQNLGVEVTQAHRIFYVDGFQVEDAARPTQLAYGDLLGCAWTGTKNASTSTRTVSRLRYAYGDVIDGLGDYSIRIVWTPRFADLAASHYLFEDSDDDLGLWLDSSQRYNFEASVTDSIQSAAVTLTPGTPEIIHITYNGTTGTVYRNGASLVTGALTANATLPTYLYVGSSDTPAGHIDATITGFASFRTTMTAAQVLADYGQVRYQAADGERIDPLPWLYTVDGDNIVDNDNYAAGGLYNFCVVGGLMGDDLDLSIKVDSSNTFVLAAGVTAGVLPVDQRLMDKDILTTAGTNTLLFVNGTGTADTDANGDDVLRVSLSTATATLFTTAITAAGAELLKAIKSVVGYFVAKDAGTRTNVQIRLSLEFGGANERFTTPWRSIGTTTAFRPFVTPELSFDLEGYILDSTRIMGLIVEAKRTTGASTENFDVSHGIVLTNYAAVYAGDITAVGGGSMAYIRDRVLEIVDDSVSTTQTRGRRLFNRPIKVYPNRLNVIMWQHTFDNYNSNSIWTTGYNLEIEQFTTTPRFDIY